ncbi:MAG: LysR family transcriptional regulator [Solirubrobacterales bacterium]|nr:LysR family transcriptional regulator [Solirubrobacterales bacterium]
MLDVRRLRVLREVARCGSFSAAADSLGYTQPAISRHVALLERETGATLLERRPSGVRLTDAGQLLVRHADAVLARLRDAEDELDELLGLRAGKLRMSTLTSAAATIMPLAITEFRERLPDVELSVAMLDPPGVLPQLRSGDVDLSVCNQASHLELPDIDGLVLFEEPMFVALPQGHPLTRRKHLALADLAEERWMLGTTHACPDSDRFLGACRGAGFEPQIAFQHDDYTAIMGFVGAGVGAASVPEMVARNAPSNVCIRSPRGLRLTRPICAVMPSGYQSRPARAMVEILQEVSQRWCAGEDRTVLAPVRAA